MKNVLETMVKWFSNPRQRDSAAHDVQIAPLPEHERRLQELEKSGRMLFLP
jgi:hypothetical protein